MERPRIEKKPLLRSCEACRASKIRCLPAAESDSKCQRCFRFRRECVFSEAKARSRRGPNNSGRVADLEKKIDHLSSLLEPTNSDNSLPPIDPGRVYHQSPVVTGTIPQLNNPLTPDSQLAVGSPNSALQNSATSSASDTIDKGFLTAAQASHLIHNFQHETLGFPFLIIPQIDVPQFRWERPFLLLAILIAASRENYSLQDALDGEFRRNLGSKVMMEGARSLDLIQGLVLYIAWYYHRFTVPDKQLYMLVQLAATMALDLDLEKLSPSEEETGASIEAKRTLVAVYYFSSCTSMILRKPITMKYSHKIWECCRSLGVAGNAPDDKYLIHYIELQGLAEEIGETFGYTDEPSPALNKMGGIEGIEFRVNTYQQRLQQQRSSIPPNAPASLLFTFDSVSIYLHEVVLHIPSVARSSPPNTPTHLTPQSHSAISNLLWAGLDSTKRLLNHFLNFTPHQIVTQTCIEKGRLAHAIVVLIKLSFARTPDFDGFPLQQACHVTEYLDRLATTVGSVSSSNGGSGGDLHAGVGGGAAGGAPPSGRQDSFSQFRITTQTVKTWYERVASMGAIGDPSTAVKEFPGMSPWKLMDLAKEESIFNFCWKDLDVLFPEPMPTPMAEGMAVDDGTVAGHGV